MSKKDSIQYMLNILLVIFAFLLAIFGSLASWLAVNFTTTLITNPILYGIAILTEMTIIVSIILVHTKMMRHVKDLEEL